MKLPTSEIKDSGEILTQSPLVAMSLYPRIYYTS